MNGAGTFYCVKCNRLEEAGQASIMFRTGYYRVIHPLGCCVACESAESAVSGLIADLHRGLETETVQPYFANDFRGGYTAMAGNGHGQPFGSVR